MSSEQKVSGWRDPFITYTVQSQTVFFAYLASEQILPFGFAGQNDVSSQIYAYARQPYHHKIPITHPRLPFFRLQATTEADFFVISIW